MTEILQGAGDAIVSPAAILASHTDNQFRDFSCDRRSSRVGPVFGAIEFAGDQLRYQPRMVSGLATEATGSSE